MRSVNRITLACLVLVGFALVGNSSPGLRAASPKQQPRVDSRELAFEIPKTGIVRRGQGQRVIVHDDEGDEQVALLHCEVGDRRLVVLPSGRLDSLPKSETKMTSEPFKPATKDELVAELRAQGFSKFKTRSTARYVYLYNSSDEFYKGASRILETMHPAIVAYFKRLKLPVHEPAGPLVVIMFRNEEQFRQFEPVPAGMVAYYNSLSNHIVMYEQSKLVDVAPELAIKQSISTIAHEGVHQILHNIGVQERLSRWPLWITEGLAEYFAPTTVSDRLRWKGVGQPHDMRMFEINKIFKAGYESHGQLIENTVSAARLNSSGYAVAWSLTHYLASRHKEKFQDYLREVAKRGPLEPRDAGAAVVEQKKLFEEYFGADYAALEDGLIRHLHSLPYVDPVANQTHYVVMLNTTTLRSAGVTTSPAAVERWQEETLLKLPQAARAGAAFNVMPFADKDSAEEYVRHWLSSR